MYIRRVVGQGHVRTELLQTRPAVGTVTIRVDQATDCSEVTGLELGDCGANLSDTADDLMSRNARIDSGHCTPLITDLMQVRVTNTAEKDLDLNVAVARIAPWNRGGDKLRFWVCSRVSSRFILPT